MVLIRIVVFGTISNSLNKKKTGGGCRNEIIQITVLLRSVRIIGRIFETR